MEMADIDKYVQYCIYKYKTFQYNIQIFLNDDLITQTSFVENYEITTGQYKGNLFWG